MADNSMRISTISLEVICTKEPMPSTFKFHLMLKFIQGKS